MKRTCLLLFVLPLASCFAQDKTLTAAETKSPALEVSVNLDSYKNLDFAKLAVSWKSTGATDVSLVSRDQVINLALAGTIILPEGHYLFVASNGDYLTVKPVGGHLDCFPNKPPCCKGCMGRGITGLITEFDPDDFNAFAFKVIIRTTMSLDHIADRSAEYLQLMGYGVPSPEAFINSKVWDRPRDAMLIYTSTYIEHPSLRQSERDRSVNGERKHRAALVVMVAPTWESIGERLTDKNIKEITYRLFVIAYVQENRPRQNDEWKSAGLDGFEMSRHLCELVAHGIVERIER